MLVSAGHERFVAITKKLYILQYYENISLEIMIFICSIMYKQLSNACNKSTSYFNQTDFYQVPKFLSLVQEKDKHQILRN